jgi:CubicO group peptidase (beta-lactamase class C family)
MKYPDSLRSVLLVLAMIGGSLPALPVPAAEAESPDQADQKSTSSAAVHAAEEAEITTAGQATFILPATWWLTRASDHLLLEDPERELRLWLFEYDGIASLDAIAATVQRAQPGFGRTVDDTVNPPPSGGWDEITQVSYTTSVEEARVIGAGARRKGSKVYVSFLDAPVAAVQRRGAQLSQILGSFAAPGADEEDLAGREAKAFDQAVATELDAFIKTAMSALSAPGLAIAVVQDGAIVFERGFGVKELGTERAVTTETRFMIGSTSKSLTSLMLAALVDRGKLSWDTPLMKVLPSFALGDPEVTPKVRVHHSMCACTGLPRQDMEFIFEFEGRDVEDRLAELAGMRPTTGFGETFQYSNALVSAGGFAGATVLYPDSPYMEAYEAALNDTVLGPLGLDSTTYRTDLVVKGDHALPHGRDFDQEYRAIPLQWEAAVTSVVPAGGLWSSVGDLATLMLLELADGKDAAGQQVISAENILRRREPSVQVSDDTHYGLALFVSDYRGLQQVGHGGNTLGFTATWNFYPEHDLGLVMLTNAAAANAMTGAIERRLIELLFDARPEAAARIEFQARRLSEVAALELPKLTAPPPAEWIDPWLGEWHSDALGQLTLERKQGKVRADVGEWQAGVGRYTDAGSSVILMTTAPVAGLPFIPQGDGTLLLDVGQQQYVFTRREAEEE